ncbi:hypothetical protein DFH09DRAFT_1500177 [Mycena vulgaris]|nr:hypothetical protein DFH09DRAFT_1500177 [Mycena vulgaris]
MQRNRATLYTGTSALPRILSLSTTNVTAALASALIAGLLSLATLPGHHKPWACAPFLFGLWTALACFNAALVLDLHPHRGARIDRGGVVHILPYFRLCRMTQYRQRERDRAEAPKAVPTLFLDGLVCEDTIFPPEYIVYERIGCHLVSPARAMFLLSLIPPCILSVCSLVMCVPMWRRAKKTFGWKRRRTPCISNQRFARVVFFMAMEALVALIGTAVLLATTIHSKPWTATTRTLASAVPVRVWCANPALRVRLQAPPIIACLLAVLFILESPPRDAVAGYCALLSKEGDMVYTPTAGRNRPRIEYKDAQSHERHDFEFDLNPFPRLRNVMGSGLYLGLGIRGPSAQGEYGARPAAVVGVLQVAPLDGEATAQDDRLRSWSSVSFSTKAGSSSSSSSASLEMDSPCVLR